MTRLNVFFCFALGIFALRMVTVNAACKVCSSVSYAACVNETGFVVCLDGITMSSMYGVCPAGQVCTEKQGICRPRSTNSPTCGKCNVCYNAFSCKSRTQFEYCNGNGTTGVVIKCPEGEYCSLNNFIKFQNICVKACMGEPTCFADEEVATPAPNLTYKDVCSGKTERGIHENVYDPTCKTYVYCKEPNQKENAILFTCDRGYFNAVLTKCISDKPGRCA